MRGMGNADEIGQDRGMGEFEEFEECNHQDKLKCLSKMYTILLLSTWFYWFEYPKKNISSGLGNSLCTYAFLHTSFWYFECFKKPTIELAFDGNLKGRIQILVKLGIFKCILSNLQMAPEFPEKNLKLIILPKRIYIG